MATVTHKVRDDGAHVIGVTVDKVFVPFVTIDAARFAQLHESAVQAAENENGEDGETSA